MSLVNYKEHFDNAYQTVFQKVLVAKEIMNTRFEKVLKFGESVERIKYDLSGIRVRTVTRGNASTIDTITDSSELININLEKEAVFHISDGEVTQAGPLNPGETIGAEIARKVAIDLDARCFAEVLSALYDFDNGDLTTTVSSGTPITLNSTTVPQMVTRMPAKLRRNNIDVVTSLAFVVDSYAASDVAQYLLGKNIDLAESVFKNGYTADVSNAKMYVTENLTGEVKFTNAANFANGETIVINGITFTAVTTIGATPGNFLIGGSTAVSMTNLAGLINNPGTTNANQVALSAANQIVVTDDLRLAATSDATSITIVGIGSGRLAASETGANTTLTYSLIHSYFGKKGAIDLVVQDSKESDMRPTADRRGTNVFSSYLAGIKTFDDGKKQFLDVLIAA